MREERTSSAHQKQLSLAHVAGRAIVAKVAGRTVVAEGVGLAMPGNICYLLFDLLICKGPSIGEARKHPKKNKNTTSIPCMHIFGGQTKVRKTHIVRINMRYDYVLRSFLRVEIFSNETLTFSFFFHCDNFFV